MELPAFGRQLRVFTNFMTNFNSTKFIKKLCAIGERQLYGEYLALQLIKKTLSAANIEYKLQKFKTSVPKFISSEIRSDGKKIDSIPTSFVSGKITNNYNILSSLSSSQNFLYDVNINFNPRCKTISRSNHYFAPAVAISRSDLRTISKAKKLEGVVKVRRVSYNSANVMIGNTVNPQVITFSHYDSIGPGAVDNASGVALCLDVLIREPVLLKENLFVIAGNEELSYDQPIYWGRGYRQFQLKYSKLFESAKQIIVVDCVGQTKPIVFSNSRIIKLGFPIDKLNRFNRKIKMISGRFEELMSIYHSSLDTPNKIKLGYFKHAGKILLKFLKQAA